MAQVYSTAQAAKLTQVSEGTVRNYVRAPMYAEYFSGGASPAPGQPRQLSEHDLTLLAFIREKTAAGVTHDQIAAQIAAGDMSGFTWSAPEASPEEAPSWEQPKRQPEPQAAPLAIMAQTLTAELAAAHAREQAVWDRLIAAEARAAPARRGSLRQSRPLRAGDSSAACSGVDGHLVKLARVACKYPFGSASGVPNGTPGQARARSVQIPQRQVSGFGHLYHGQARARSVQIPPQKCRRSPLAGVPRAP